MVKTKVMKRNLKIGDYEPRVVKKGFEETTLSLKEGEVYWIVQVDKEGQFDCSTQFEAKTLSMLIRIEKILKNKMRVK